MIRPSTALFFPSLALAAGWIAGGCAPAAKPAAKPAAPVAKSADADHAGHDDHADHVHPETLAEGIAELETAVKDVAEKLGSGATEAADDAVHAVGHLLGDLEELLKKQELTADIKQAGTKALAELGECFDKLDVAMHAAEGEGESPATVHASVSERVMAAVTVLKERFAGDKATGESK